jgi:hypothetical protein
MYGGGIGTLTVSAKSAADGDDAAWVPVWTKGGDQGGSWQAATIYSASGSYYRVTATRGGGNRGDIAVDNLNVIWCTDAPTAVPSNIGDTYAPTVSPTAVPTASPTDTPTSAPTSPLLYILATIGTCTLPYTFIDTVATCEAAAVILSLADTTAVYTPLNFHNPYGCYYKQSIGALYFNPDGGKTDDDTDRMSLCKLATTAPTAAPTAPTTAPTATPTNVGDTHAPTVSPTTAPTFGPPTNWADLKASCSDSACDTANGGCTIPLSDDFVMGSYTSEISFSGKTVTIWGQGTVLDASGGGRFFNGNAAGSLLELHDSVLQNSQTDSSVSGRVLVLVVATVIKLF